MLIEWLGGVSRLAGQACFLWRGSHGKVDIVYRLRTKFVYTLLVRQCVYLIVYSIMQLWMTQRGIVNIPGQCASEVQQGLVGVRITRSKIHPSHSTGEEQPYIKSGETAGE